MKRIHIHRTIISVLAAILITASGTTANAQDIVCAKHALIVEYLKGEFQELQRAFGLVGDKAILELFLSPHGATWTIVITDVSGRSCILAAGDSWEQRLEVPELKT
ncbi:hypothetical protein [Phyllobacterium myrsinacearum]|jgi:hypothetical protein|uniref:Uncharacterized protein n=1 Tax=Phyllobacterium myrsinacearum TaxID=28101 RepID=A0A2S9JGS7_9HYPH|nr:hypothetical protein [Phyllobacterium myrsinacearum]PRD52186.1 hypothetical protein C5750_14825 [Phyllobacterium myrsinacearum]PWV83765.1 hypothetical protein DEV92_12043 [Phyllobacterium myrsinacearum]RZS74111.1 hypothetical protein EV217_5187 [Phyllobacterium myrsinacearum]RZV04712.1 hypothetical protein EV654_3514 [Phyllobacterium myrsinacearum]